MVLSWYEFAWISLWLRDSYEWVSPSWRDILRKWTDVFLGKKAGPSDTLDHDWGLWNLNKISWHEATCCWKTLNTGSFHPTLFHQYEFYTRIYWAFCEMTCLSKVRFLVCTLTILNPNLEAPTTYLNSLSKWGTTRCTTEKICRPSAGYWQLRMFDCFI